MTERVDDLLERMTLEEKVAQIVGLWMRFDPDSGEFVPHQGTFGILPSEDIEPSQRIAHGLGQVTRLFGSAPLSPQEGATRA